MTSSQNKIASINTGLFVSAAFVVALLLYITRNAMSKMSSFDALEISSLVFLFLFLPNLFKKNQEIIFLGIMVFVPVIGIVFKDYSHVLKFILISASFGTFLLSIKKIRCLNIHYFLLSFFTALFLILLIYSSSIQILSPVFLELIVNGKAVPDTLFHASISHSLLQSHEVSTRIYGVFPFKYHWFSHYVYGGLSLWTDLKIIQFYHWVYPVFVMTLFVKYLFILFQKTLLYFGFQDLWDKFFFPGLLVYILVFIGTFGFPSYLSSESLMLSHVFQMIFWMLILQYREKSINNIWVSLLLFGVILLILFTKASVGLLTFIVAAYLYFRYLTKVTQFIFLTLISIGFIAICYYGFYNIRPHQDSLGFVHRLQNFTWNVISYFSYSVSIFYLILFYLHEKNTQVFSLKNFKTQKFIFEEIVFMSLVMGLFLGLFFGNHKGDSFYFGSTFIFINFIVLCMMFAKYLSVPIDYFKIKVVSYGLFLLCFIFTPQFFSIKQFTYREKNDAQKNNPLMKQLVMTLMNEKYAEKTIICVPKNEKWFYDSLMVKHTAPFIIPGISTNVALSSIKKDFFVHGEYSFSFYQNVYQDLTTTQQIVKKASSLGFKNVIIIKSDGSKLIIQKYLINKTIENKS